MILYAYGVNTEIWITHRQNLPGLFGNLSELWSLVHNPK